MKRPQIIRTRVNTSLPLPEIVASYRTDVEDGKWKVTSVTDPFNSNSNLEKKTMRVSSMTDETSRYFKVRELTRTRVTPIQSVEELSKYTTESPAALAAAEEIRLNFLTKKLGYNTDLMKDGRERKLGERFAEVGSIESWNEAVAYGASLIGTKAFNSFLTGLRQENNDWATQMRGLSDKILEQYKEVSLYYLGNSQPIDLYNPFWEGISVPYGYTFTRSMAQWIDSWFKKPEEPGDEFEFDDEDFESEEFLGYQEEGGFEDLRIDNSVPRPLAVKGYMHRKKKSSAMGKSVRYPQRMLTDPQKRIFTQKTRVNGGVVLIDVSGSMSLSDDDVQVILENAPGALVMAYSSNSYKGEPNLTILADRGKQVAKIPESIFRGGNGVDGPALEYAIKRRKGNELVIWVTDGLVMGKGGVTNIELGIRCAATVMKERVIMIPSVEEAVKQFRELRFSSNPAGWVKEGINLISNSLRSR